MAFTWTSERQNITSYSKVHFTHCLYVLLFKDIVTPLIIVTFLNWLERNFDLPNPTWKHACKTEIITEVKILFSFFKLDAGNYSNFNLWTKNSKMYPLIALIIWNYQTKRLQQVLFLLSYYGMHSWLISDYNVPCPMAYFSEHLTFKICL